MLISISCYYQTLLFLSLSIINSLYKVLPPVCCRYKKVAFLDTDVGQTEFTPPGILSLCVIDKPTPGIWFLLQSVSRVLSCIMKREFVSCLLPDLLLFTFVHTLKNRFDNSMHEDARKVLISWLSYCCQDLQNRNEFVYCSS